MTTTAPPPLYTLHDADPSQVRDTVLSIWRGGLRPDDRRAAKYDWFYLRSPTGAPLLQLLRHESSSDWVGVCAAGRRRMLWRGREIRSGVIVDFAVLPDHRSLGPALMLQQGLLAAGARQLDLLYGFPNPKAAAAFKRIGYSKLTDLVCFARVLRHAGYLSRHMPAPLAGILGAFLDLAVAIRDGFRRLRLPRVHAEWGDRADERMDDLWQRSEHGDGLVAIRDAQHARWRFDSAPLGATRYLLISNKQSGDLLAWFATRSDSGNLRVRDFWSDDAIRGVGRPYIDALLQAARSTGHVAVSVQIAAPESGLARWRSRGFFERGRRPVYGRWSVPSSEAAPSTELYLTPADEDG